MTNLRFARVVAFAACVAVPSLGSAATAATASTAAMPTCKSGDAVVWENTSSKSKAYHTSGDSYFGKTAHGKYACESDAKTAGYHAASSTTAKTKGSDAADTASAEPSPASSAKPKHHHHHASASPAPGTSGMSRKPTMGSSTPLPNGSASPSP